VTEHRIDPEKLAAFLDGRLDEKERQEVLRVLAESPDEFETFAQAAALLGELQTGEAAAGRERPEPGTSRWLVRRVLLAGIPTLAAAMLAGWFVIPRLTAGGDFDVVGFNGAALLASANALASRLEGGWVDAGVPVPRGAGGAMSARGRAFSMGVRLSDLEVALSTADTVARSRLAHEIPELLGAIEGGAAIEARYRQLLSGVSTEADRSAAARDVRLLLLDSPWLDLGAWTETARLALLVDGDAFFRKRSNRTALEGILRRIPQTDPAVALGRSILDHMADGPTDRERFALGQALARMARLSAE
jgi:hypothetical protein